MKVFTGHVGSRKIFGLGNCSVRIREREDEVPRVYLRYPDRIEEWLLEEREGELYLAEMVAVNSWRCPDGTVGIRRWSRELH